MMGSFIVIYSTLNKIQYKSEILTPSKRFPLYMAIMDFGTSIVTLPNLFFPMQKDSLMIGNWCTSLGFITSLFIVMNMMLMASLALITYLRICKRYVMNLGKKDWILFSLILFPTLTISFVTWYLNGFGPDTFWCFINQEETDGLEIRPPSFFYGPITAPTAAQERTLKNITKATRKMSSYIFLQMLQYTPIIIYSLCILMNQMQTWVYVLTVVMLNLGGVAKSFVFMKSNNTIGEERKKGGNLCKYKTSSNEICFCDDDKQKDVPIITVVVNQKDLL
ncbi:hypothetical protein RhiirA4_516382 [Rhizophagus irregularis]|uniref:G-protein coupled receptors family 1 profile domain-containing protein n=1 Tax=Rhizophagus irregularis TaxID=588596 RepID=A0A2I1GFD6_9GLOM|nr:hypothetical protein RhiirA4_516382 [Rhizophagus irregularis]